MGKQGNAKQLARKLADRLSKLGKEEKKKKEPKGQTPLAIEYKP